MKLVRPLVEKLIAYVPGEQPKIKGLIKLNTNENPYPPSPKVLRAMKAAVDGRLRLYPNPTAQALREALAKLHKCSAENIIVGNGSDELLALATRAFVEPIVPPASRWRFKSDSELPARRRQHDGLCVIQYFTPSYSLYPVLADIHGARKNPVSLKEDFGLPSVSELKRGGVWDFSAALTFVTTPNAPSGRGYSTADLEKLCRAHRGVLILDEAYVDFADENAAKLADKFPHVIISRTFSKAYSLCFQRVGYFIAHPALITALDKIRDSYNVNGLGQVAAMATLQDLPHYRQNFQRVIATRTWLATELTRLGFKVRPSQTNFLLVEPPRHPAKFWLEQLRARKIIVRWFGQPGIDKYVRITIGTPAEAKALVKASRQILTG